MSDDSLRYPIGKFSPQDHYSTEEINSNLSVIEALPTKIEKVLAGLSSAQIDSPYRDGGWTGRQVIHHLADSHMNAYIRTKWALTEASPTIKAYDEKRWAETGEQKADPLLSLQLLKSLHAKWVVLLRSLTAEELKKDFLHPETGKKISIERMTALYAWHGEHHLGHLKIVSKL